ncbi:MAG TPA: DUF2785 domain-containing protein [Actinomycetota bacterium]|jgi:hypothetical protein
MRTGPGLWQGIRKAGFAVPVRPSLEVLTTDLLDNLANLDPDQRDLGVEILETWIGRGVYQPEALRAIGDRVTANLQVGLGEPDDDSVFLRAASLTVLKRLVEADNRRSFLRRKELEAWFDAVVAALENERDLRAYVPDKGWAHALAQLADTLRLFVLSRHLGPEAPRRILDAVGARVTARSQEPFRSYEDEWLAYTVRTILRFKPLGVAELRDWLAGLASPPGHPSWQAPQLDPQEAAARHNTVSLLRSLYFQLAVGRDRPPTAGQLVPAVREAIQELDIGFYELP